MDISQSCREMRDRVSCPRFIEPFRPSSRNEGQGIMSPVSWGGPSPLSPLVGRHIPPSNHHLRRLPVEPPRRILDPSMMIKGTPMNTRKAVLALALLALGLALSPPV